MMTNLLVVEGPVGSPGGRRVTHNPPSVENLELSLRDLKLTALSKPFGHVRWRGSRYPSSISCLGPVFYLTCMKDAKSAIAGVIWKGCGCAAWRVRRRAASKVIPSPGKITVLSAGRHTDRR